MGYLKFSADRLFTGRQWLGREAVLVSRPDGQIVGIIDRKEAGEEVQELRGWLCPGFINSHCHLELSHLRGAIPQQTGMLGFLQAVMRQRTQLPGQIAEAIEAGEAELIRNGIVAVGDICNNTDTLAQKLKGRLQYHNFVEVTGFVPALADTRFETLYKVFDAFRQNPGAGNTSLVPHAPYSVSANLFRLITQVPGNRILSLHNQESQAEADFFRDKSGDLLTLYRDLNIELDFFEAPGCSSLAAVLPYFNADQRLLLVHNVTSTADELSWLKEYTGRGKTSNKKPITEIYFCVCPSANQYIGNGMPPLPILIQSGFPLLLGTDSLASNTQLSILAEMQLLEQQFPAIPVETYFPWATLSGAEALGLEDNLGSFDQGRRPGILLLEETGSGKLGSRARVKRLL